MSKKFKSKKTIITLGLLAVLVIANVIPVSAGTTRSFYNMTLRAYGGVSELTHRAKENNRQYSWVQITSMTGASRVNTKFMLNSTLEYNPWYGINAGDTSNHRLDYSNVGYPTAGTQIYLVASNDNWSTGSGSISGTVDYE